MGSYAPRGNAKVVECCPRCKMKHIIKLRKKPLKPGEEIVFKYPCSGCGRRFYVSARLELIVSTDVHYPDFVPF